MVCTTCKNCGSEFHWDWEDAFNKFGFDDGDGQVETWEVIAALEKAGYEVTSTDWGLHNHVIDSIKKDGVEYIPDEKSEFTFGYDCPRKYLPEKIIELLDEQLPETY